MCLIVLSIYLLKDNDSGNYIPAVVILHKIIAGALFFHIRYIYMSITMERIRE